MRSGLREKRRSGVSADQVLRCATLKPTAAAATPTTSRTQYSHATALIPQETPTVGVIPRRLPADRGAGVPCHGPSRIPTNGKKTPLLGPGVYPVPLRAR